MDVILGGIADSVMKTLFDIIKTIFFYLDYVVYSFIPMLYKMILYLANVNLYDGNKTLAALTGRVYIIVGIFMLFKLSFSIIKYIADPNAFSDSAKGFTNLVKNVVIALVLLVLVPYIFKVAYDIQKEIMVSNVIPNFITGSEDILDVNNFESEAKDIQFLMFSPFFSINYGAGGDNGPLRVCDPSLEDGKYPLANIIGTVDMALGTDGSGNCLLAVAEQMDADENIKASGIKITDFFKTATTDHRNFGSLAPLVTWSVDGESAINYMPVVSTICGGYLVFLLLSFCFDIGTRAIRLLFLQILSPIAILSSIDPTESSQNSKLKDWGSECLKTFLSVFLRLAIIFIIIQIFKVITEFIFYKGLEDQTYGGLPKPSGVENIFVFIFLVLGSFQAAKNLPGMIEKAFGIKMSGELNLNPFKNPFVAGAAGLGVGAVAGGLTGGMAAFSTARNMDEGVGRSLVSGVGGVLSGGLTGGIRGAKTKDITKGWEAGSQSGGRIARRMEVRTATGGIQGIPGMAFDRLRDKMGAPTTYESREARAQRYDDVIKKIDVVKNRATGELSKKSNAWKTIQAQRTRYEQIFREGGQVDNNTAEERVSHYDNLVLEAASSWQKSSREFNSSYYQTMDHSSKEYIQKRDEVSAAKSKYDSARKTYEHMEDIYTKGDMTSEMYVDLNNSLYQKEQNMVRDYINNNAIKDSSGKVTGYKDADLALNMQALKKSIKDTHDDSLQSIKLDDWKDIAGDGNKESVKAIADSTALGIRSDKRHNDAFDRDQAIHGARSDAHMKH